MAHLNKNDPEDTIFEQMERVFRVPRRAGMGLLLIERRTIKARYRLLPLNLTLCSLSMALSIAATIILKLGIQTNTVYQILFALQIFVYSLSPFGALLLPLTKLRQLQRCMAGISSADNEMRRIGFQPGSGARSSTLHWAHWALYLALISFRLYDVPLKIFFWVLMIYVPNVFILVFLDQVESCLALLQVRLDAVIAAANQIVSTSATFRKLVDLTRCHFILCRSGSYLNSFYSGTFLMITAFFFIVTVGETYNVYYYSHPNHFHRGNLITRVGWAFLGATTLLRITSCCVITSEKAEEFNTLLSHLMYNDKSSQLLSNRKLRVYVAMKKGITFSACGLYNVDFNLLHSIVAAVTTYMVVLMQFEQPHKNVGSTELSIVNEIANLSTTLSTTTISK